MPNLSKIWAKNKFAKPCQRAISKQYSFGLFDQSIAKILTMRFQGLVKPLEIA